ncbi:MAG: hypothetical protein KDB27_18985 [Planctomycetales bacterium]|nr:hypothetical protein [Planctomycetales bacterium]
MTKHDTSFRVICTLILVYLLSAQNCLSTEFEIVIPNAFVDTEGDDPGGAPSQTFMNGTRIQEIYPSSEVSAQQNGWVSSSVLV